MTDHIVETLTCTTVPKYSSVIAASEIPFTILACGAVLVILALQIDSYVRIRIRLKKEMKHG